MMKLRTIWFENFIQYMRNNLTRVLLFAVILSTGLMMNLVTKAKYISYVNSYNHAVAGSFYFTSNYLEEDSQNKTYTISSWDQDKYKVDLRIQNFENSLLYNGADSGCYYCVEAQMFTDAGYTQPDANFVPTITYQTGTTQVEHDGKTYVYLPGQESTFNKENGTQLVTVSMKANEKVGTKRYLKITAKTMTVAQMQAAKNSGEITSIPTGPIFDTKLSAKFELNINTGAQITTTLEYNKANTSSELIYNIRCTSTEGGASSKVRVYYDSSKVKFEDILRYPVSKRDENNKEDSYRYIELDVYSTSITKLVFFKRKMADAVGTEITVDNGNNSTIYYEMVTYTQN